MKECPSCGEPTSEPNARLIRDSCGHKKCRLCLLHEENSCKLCEGHGFQSPKKIERIGNFDYALPGLETPNYENPECTPSELIINEILHEYDKIGSPTSESDFVVNEDLFITEDGASREDDESNHCVENESPRETAEDRNSIDVVEKMTYKVGNERCSQPNQVDESIDNPLLELVDNSPDTHINPSPNTELDVCEIGNATQTSDKCITITSRNDIKILQIEIIRSDRDLRLLYRPAFTQSLETESSSREVEENEFENAFKIPNGTPIRTPNRTPCRTPSQFDCGSPYSISNYLLFNKRSEDDKNAEENTDESDDDSQNLNDVESSPETEVNESNGATAVEPINNESSDNIECANRHFKKRRKMQELSVTTSVTHESDEDKENRTMKKPDEAGEKQDKKSTKGTPKTKRAKDAEPVSSKGEKKRKPRVTRKKPQNPRPSSKDWSHIEELPGPPVAYRCTCCSKTFGNPRGKWYHAACPKDGAAGGYECKLCERRFGKRSHYEYHERWHSGEKPFACETCGKGFIQRNKLNRHMSVHKGLQDIECLHCGKKFSSKNYLKNHIIIHQNNSYKCDFCSKTFRLLTNKTRHERMHSTARPFKCKICSNGFNNKSDLARHEKIHGKSRPFSCQHCNRLFLTKFEVRRHVTIHSDEKPHSCEHCSLNFRRKDNLNRHIMNHHTNEHGEPIVPWEIAETTEKDKPVAEDSIGSTGKKRAKAKAGENLSSAKPNKPKSKPKKTKRSSSVSSAKSSAKLARQTAAILLSLEHVVPGRRVNPTDPIPVEEALDLNRRIEEKINSRGPLCDFPGLSRISFASKKDSSCSTRPSRRSSSSKSSNGGGLASKPNHRERSKTGESS